MMGSEARTAEMMLRSAGFAPEAAIPPLYTCEGDDVSPPLAWSGTPVNARSFALVCEDPDAPRGTYIHWVLYNISGDAVELKQSVPALAELPSGARHGRNSAGKLAYMGPCPPRGPAHRYFFRLYALDISLNLDPGATRDELTRAMDQHILAQGTLMGTYQRVGR
jgi:Raf kinase inhibitor-like YbhB/YbcL family protein